MPSKKSRAPRQSETARAMTPASPFILPAISLTEKFAEKYKFSPEQTEMGNFHLRDVGAPEISGFGGLTLATIHRRSTSIYDTLQNKGIRLKNRNVPGFFNFIFKNPHQNLNIQWPDNENKGALLREKFILLSERWKDVVKKIAEGNPNKQIAADLDVSVRTLDIDIEDIKIRLGLKSKNAIALAYWLSRLPETDIPQTDASTSTDMPILATA